MRVFVFTFSVLIYLDNISANVRCTSATSSLAPKYYLTEKCYRSNLGSIARANFKSRESCQRFGLEKRAMAINFSPPEAAAMAKNTEPLEYTCEVLTCPESIGGLSLVNDTRFDYYSIFTKPLPSLNSTCVPGIGMFYLLTSPKNFSEARDQCSAVSGELADVTSDQRTDFLAQLLAGASVDEAFVGLRRYNSTPFYKLDGDSLDCTNYRAWEPGHPRRQLNQFDCALLTRHRAWRSASCSGQYLALCELVPRGPYRRGSIFNSTTQIVKDTKVTRN